MKALIWIVALVVVVFGAYWIFNSANTVENEPVSDEEQAALVEETLDTLGNDLQGETDVVVEAQAPVDASVEEETSGGVVEKKAQ